MTNFAAEYQSLTNRREGLVSRIAVLEANEERKREEREQIHAELTEAGVDPTKPEEEIARLTREIETLRITIEKQLDDIENQLDPKVSPPVAKMQPVEPPQTAAVQPTAPDTESFDLDID